jgi:phytoene synthase
MLDDDLDAVIRQADPDRWLSSRFITDAALRSDVVALYAYDQELSRAGRVTSNALLAEIRLTWWREVLDEIFAGGQVRYHPAAARLTGVIRRHALPRAPLELMIDGRIDTLGSAELPIEDALRWSEAVAGSAALVVGVILDPIAAHSTTAAAGALWGLSVLARAGKTRRAAAATHIAAVLPGVARDAARLSPKAFPAVAHATLVRDLARPGNRRPLMRQARLIFAVTTGRL